MGSLRWLFLFALIAALSVAAQTTRFQNINVLGTGGMPLYAISGSPINAPHAVSGSVSLSAGSATVTLSGSAVFAASNSYICAANDSTAANAVKVSNTSSTQFSLTGTGSGAVNFLCIGN